MENNSVTVTKNELDFLFNEFYRQNKATIDIYNWYLEKLRVVEMQNTEVNNNVENKM